VARDQYEIQVTTRGVSLGPFVAVLSEIDGYPGEVYFFVWRWNVCTTQHPRIVAWLLARVPTDVVEV